MSRLRGQKATRQLYKTWARRKMRESALGKEKPVPGAIQGTKADASDRRASKATRDGGCHTPRTAQERQAAPFLRRRRERIYKWKLDNKDYNLYFLIR
jgi:hypothetical protein